MTIYRFAFLILFITSIGSAWAYSPTPVYPAPVPMQPPLPPGVALGSPEADAFYAKMAPAAPTPVAAAVPTPVVVQTPVPTTPSAANPTPVPVVRSTPVAPAPPIQNVISIVPVDTAASTPAPTSSVDYKKFRDPFKEPVISEVTETKSELERYPVTDFKVTAIITGPLRMRAMLLAPNAKVHYVSEKMKIGLREGVIVKITTKSVVVREKVVNPLGEVELFDTEIGMDQPAVPAGMSQ